MKIEHRIHEVPERNVTKKFLFLELVKVIASIGHNVIFTITQYMCTCGDTIDARMFCCLLLVALLNISDDLNFLQAWF